jgi:hypothetical protein
MARKTFEQLIDEAKNAESTAQTEPVSEETVSEVQTEETEPVSQDQPEPEKPVEQDQPAPEPEKAPEPEPTKDAVMDEIDNTNSIIRKRLEKQSKKYEEALAEKDAKYDELKKELEELKKVAQPKPVVKNRGDFEHDEDYVAYLTRQQIAEVDAEKAKAKAEADAKEAERKAAEEKEQADIRERQTRFLANIDECFEGDEKIEFLKRIQHANSKGLGTLLDACPIATEYLLGSPKGPLVFQKVLNDAETFKRIFPVRGISPLDQYSELKAIEREIIFAKSAPAVDPTPSVAVAKPKLGRPGVQGQGGTMGDPMADPKSRRDYMRKLMGY